MVSRRLLRIKVLKGMYSFLNSENQSIDNAEKELLFSINKTYELYHHIMHLIVDVSDYARQQMELSKQKLRPTADEINPNTKFVDNIFVELVRNNTVISGYCDKHKLNWRTSPELVKKLYLSMQTKPYYQKYMDSAVRSFAEDRKLAITFLESELDEWDDFENLIEEQSIYWTDDIEFVISQVIKTYMGFKEGQESSTFVMPLYKDMEDKKFVSLLFRNTAYNHNEYQQYLDKHTKNWDLERIAFMDVIIMITAIAEILQFDEIPVKVSLNEYIELAKYYSTRNSSTFINGVLDKVVAELSEQSKIHKQGRGLIG